MSRERPDLKGEGAFYIWSLEEIRAVLGKPAAEWFCYRYGVREGSNVASDPHGEFTGKNILYQARTVEETAEYFGRPPGESASRSRRRGQPADGGARSTRAPYAGTTRSSPPGTA